jgi:hypothetical protein
MRWWWGPLCSRPTGWAGFFTVLPHWNNISRVVLSLHIRTHYSDSKPTSFCSLLNAACLAEKQQIPVVWSLVSPDRGSNPRSTALEGVHTNHLGNISIEIKHNQIRKKNSVTLMQVSSRGLTKRMLFLWGHITSGIIKLSLYARFRVDTHY